MEDLGALQESLTVINIDQQTLEEIPMFVLFVFDHNNSKVHGLIFVKFAE